MSTGTGAHGRRSRARPSAIVVSTIALWLATAAAATAFWPVYESPRFIVMVAVTTVAASAIAIAGAVFRLASHLVVFAVLIAFVLLGVPLAVPDMAAFGVLPTVEGFADLATGSVLGWKQLLTIALPVGSFQSLLVPAFILVLVTVTASLSVALRSRLGELAVAGPAVLFIAGIAFGPATEFAPVALSLVLTAALVLWIVWFRMQRRSLAVASAGSGGTGSSHASDRVAPRRAAASAVLLIAIASGGAAAATDVLPPARERTVLRSAVVQPFDPREYPSPLSGFRRYHGESAEDATMLTVEGLPAGGRIRIATMDSYDGVVYAVGSDSVTSQSGSFTLLPLRVDQSAVDGTPVAIDVAVGAYTGVWVPTVGQLSAVDFIGSGSTALRESFYYNDVAGTAVSIAELAEGDRYRFTAVQPVQPDRSEIPMLAPGDAFVPQAGATPGDLSITLDRYVAGVNGDGARLAAAIDGLRAEGYVSHGVAADEPASRSGHSVDRISRLLDAPQMIGDEEQYAVTAALMARELGFPARVVVGFAPDVVEGTTTVVRGEDISAWIEVDTASSGWVMIDPTPPVREIPEDPPEEPTQVARPQQPVQPPVEEPDATDDQRPPDTVQDDPATIDPAIAALLTAVTITGWVAVAAAIAGAPAIVIAIAKSQRRRRRLRASTALQRIRGGWDEFEDSVVDHGYIAPTSATRSEFATIVGGSRSTVLAAAADRAVFSPSRPDDEEADRVWRSVGELTRSLSSGLTRRQRLSSLLSMRSFRARATARRSATSERERM